jgi:hypothetical protein
MLTLHVSVSYKKCEQAPEIDFGADQGDMAIFNFMRVMLMGFVLLLQACGGGGGGSGGTNGSTQVVTPKTVLPSSFENKSISDLPTELTQLPNLRAITSLGLTLDSVPSSLAVSDFQRNGTYSAFVIASDGSSVQAYFIGYASGTWSDLSGSLFRSAGDRVSCAKPQQSLVADLNRDGRPDVYVVCAGVISGASLQSEPQYVYLSQSDGTYVRTTTAIIAPSVTLHASSAAIADIDGNSCLDVVTTDNGSLKVMMGTCTSGSYTLNDPAANAGRVNFLYPGAAPPSNIQSVFLIPRGSAPARYDLMVGGSSAGGAASFRWYLSHNGYFDPSTVLEFRTYSLPFGDSTNRYDYLESGSYGYVYMSNTPGGAVAQSFVKLARIPLPGVSSDTTNLAYLVPAAGEPLTNWPSAIRLVNSNLRVYDAGCGLVTTLDNMSRCGKQYPIAGFVP